jgi:hypothetical protein
MPLRFKTQRLDDVLVDVRWPVVTGPVLIDWDLTYEHHSGLRPNRKATTQ